MKALNRYLQNIGETFQTEISELNRINSILQLTCVYSPDHETGGIYEKHLEQLEDILPNTYQLGKILDEIFFEDFYVFRQEEKNIVDILVGGNYLFFVTGLVGVGKTVILRKIMRDFRDSGETIFVYLNLRKEISRFRNLELEDFRKEVRDWFFNSILDQIPEENFEDWIDFQLLHDDQFSQLKRKIEFITEHPIKCIKDVRDLKKSGEFSNFFIENFPKIVPSLEIILNFINIMKIPLVICVDNLDRRSYEEQGEIISVCDSIVQEFGVPIIIAIRDTNIRKLILETRKIRRDQSPLSSVFFSETMEKIVPGNPNTVKFEVLHSSSLKNIIAKRIKFLKENEILGTLEDYRREYLKNHEMSIEQFDIEFWEIFDDVTREFVDRGMYEYSNYNIREMLAQYVSFVSTLLFNPEKDYQWEKFLLTGRRIDRTKLRTFLIKWQLNNGHVDPRGSTEKILNVYETGNSIISLLPLRLLIYSFNFEDRNPGKVLSFGEIIDDFGLLNISETEITDNLFALCKSRGAYELGLIWVDTGEIENINRSSIIKLNPAGKYFLNNISNTREYAFWCSITADLRVMNNVNVDVVKKHFTLKDTYEDKFKLEIVYNFIREFLLPNHENDLKILQGTINLPETYNGSKIQFFREKFTRDNKYYVNHLITSVTATISSDFANLDEYDRIEYKRKYNRLDRKSQAINNKFS